MTVDWSPLRGELARWRAADLTLPLWWRDDDAVKPTPALAKLLRLSEEIGVPVHSAVIPKAAEPALAEFAQAHHMMIPVVHGWAHDNHSPQGTKKAEFGQARTGSRAETEAGLARMRLLFGSNMLAMFVPPWNRIDPQVTARLAGQGFVALSTFTPRVSREVAGLVQINTHIDPINWRAGGGLVDIEQIIAKTVSLLQDRRAGHAEIEEPLGFLSHHLVHDQPIWAFNRSYLIELLDGGARPINLLNLEDNLP